MGNVCRHCGTDGKLDFDHIDPKQKVDNISSPRILDGPLHAMLEELNKCQLLCRPCHIIKTRVNGESAGGHNKIYERESPPPYGIGPTYNVFNCRCEVCKEWKRRYRKKEVDYKGKEILS